MNLTEDQQRFKEECIRERGYWVSFNDGLLAYNPDFLKTYLRYAGTPARTGPLSPRLRELIYVAVDASTTHMFAQGLAIHVRKALQFGCTPIELIEVMQLATMQGLDSVATGIDIIVEESETAGLMPPQLRAPETAEMQPLKRAYVEEFGDWPEWCDRLLLGVAGGAH